MEENKNNKKFTLSLIAVLLLVVIFVSGGTFAYFRWISDPDTQNTALNITIDENISMHIENPEVTHNKMYPTNNCAGEASMSGVSVVTIDNNTGSIARPSFKLKVKITDVNGNIITNTASAENDNNPYRYYINYAVAEENGSCTEPLYTGKFYVDGDSDCTTKNASGTCTATDWYDSEWITLENESTGFPLISNGTNSGVSFNAAPYVTTTHNYKVWAWIDETYTSLNTGDVVSDKLQDATITVSWSENSMVEQVKAKAYAVYSADDNSLRFYQSDEEIAVGDTYNGLTVTNVYTGFEDSTSVPWSSISSSVTSVVFEDTITPVSTASWFSSFSNISYIDVTNLNTSNVTNMRSMFDMAGYNITSSFTIEGMENWNTSNVTNMQTTFFQTGASATTFNISDISGWDVSNVTNMNGMFGSIGYASTNNWSLDLSGWNVYKVTSYSSFESSDNITPPNWHTSYAVYSADDTSLRFYRTYADLTTVSTYNSLAVTAVYTGFESTSYSNSDAVPWYSDGYYDAITSVVIEDEIYPTSTAYWFNYMLNVSYVAVTNLNTSNVTNMQYMFSGVGSNVNEVTITGMENWDTSNVTNMARMFEEVGSGAGTFNISNISNWNTSNVTDMSAMFLNTGGNATNEWSLNLSSWNVSKVTSYDGFNQYGPGSAGLTVENITPPNWVN